MINYRMRLNQILGNPSIPVRSTELGSFLEACSVEELKNHFQLIVDTIFGFPSYPGWSIRRLTRSAQPRETEAILKFLGPDGPLFRAIYRLLTDRNFRLEFPISSLPSVLDQRISRLDIPEFFQKKVHLVYDTYGQVTAMRNIVLNPFEYYFFMFAYLNMGIGASQSYLMGWGSMNDTLYTNLLDDYLNYFFPCDGRGVPEMSAAQGRPQTEATFSADPILENQSNISAPPRSETPHPTLFKASIFQESATVSTAARDTSFSPSAYSHQDLWRSDTIMNIFMEMWMCVDCNDTVSSLFQSNLPSVDVVKSVRIIVRHQHYFTNCLNHQALHPMEGLKRTLLHTYQKKLYVFLRHLFNRWPLDNTFRIVYETWLSYIQPWRYANTDRFRQFRDREITRIEPIWVGFLVDNILFYTVLFQQILPRCLRVDLTSPKNALMIFRTSKIFTAQENMKTLLQEIEQMLVRYIQNPEDHHGGSSYYSSYYAGSIMMESSLMEHCTPARLANVKQMLVELEPANFAYKPMFSDETRHMVKTIITAISQAMHSLGEKPEEEDQVKSSNAIFKLLAGADTAFGKGDISATPADKAKISQFLEYSKLQLSYLFDTVDSQSVESLNESVRNGGSYCNGSGLMGEDDSIHSTPGRFSTSIMSSLTPKGILTEGMVTPTGNPDLAHIRSHEVAWLVRSLILISQELNNRVGGTISRYYFDQSFLGKLARGSFAPPMLFNVIEKIAPGRQVKRVKYLPPRINLRPLATYFNVSVLIGLFLVSYIYGIGPVWILFLLIFLFIFRACILGMLERQGKVDELMTAFGPYIHDEDDGLSD